MKNIQKLLAQYLTNCWLKELRRQMDRFDSDYYYIHFPDPQESIRYSSCFGCGENIDVGEEVIDVYGVSVHDTYDCLFKAVDAKRLIAERGMID
ncbi:hypothetical protein [Paenibacillus taichungensis]|uniref:hypothetical protein n=1 Tax=Paenibacillus taichungensis TaxID=484184 RepID=UPI00399F9B49